MQEHTTGEIVLTDIVESIWSRKMSIAGAAGVFLLLAVVFLHVAEREYAVTLRLTPTASAVSTLPTGVSSLASLAGISVPAQLENNPFELYLGSLKSRETAAAIAKNEQLLRHLFPADWSEDDGAWRQPDGLVGNVTGALRSVVGASEPDWVPPDARRVQEFVEREVSVIRERNSPIVNIVMQHGDPDTATSLLIAMHNAVDDALRQRELDRTSSYVNYLREQLGNVSVTEYRLALNEIIAEQEKRRMVASSDLPFAAEPLGRPVESVRPVSPRPLLVLSLSVFLGLLIGILRAISVDQWVKARRQSQ